MHRMILAALLFLLGVSLNVWATDTLRSPNGRLKIEAGIAEFDQPFPVGEYLYYRIFYDDHLIVDSSPVRFQLRDAPDMGACMEVVDRLKKTVDAVSELPYGKSRLLRDHCNELRLYLRERQPPSREYTLVLRAYDDAAAFRLDFPRQPGLAKLILEKEQTFFRLGCGTAYALPLAHFRTPYENNYKIMPTGELPSDMLIGLPLLMQTDAGPWVAIAEADLFDYPGMYVSPFSGEKHTLISRLSPAINDSTICVAVETPHRTPWRVFMISEHPGRMIESNVILTLSEPCQIENTAWIRPGKAAWPWWSNRVVEGGTFQGGMNTATMKYYIDFAARMGFEYLLIDAGWYGKHNSPEEDITTTIPEIDLPEMIRYANEHEVGILLWLYWECVRDQMDVAFPLYEKWGIKGVKVDYMNRDDEEMVNFYRRVVEKAAQHHLLVDFHGAYKPAGLRRTYPNLLTREGVLGLEYSKWSDRCNPEHEVILPYTRMLVGPMDFTPGSFHVANKETFNARFTNPMAQGTRARQLAMYVVYESPLQMVVDHPASYFGQSGVDFLTQVPTTWEETRFIDGEIGESIILARRNGNEWYVGGMSDWNARHMRLHLSFLENGNYLAEIYEDGSKAENIPEQINCRITTVNAADTLDFRMAPGGGFAIRLSPTWAP